MREFNPKYAIGQKYMSRGKHKRECVVVDIHRTYNSKDELVKYCYVSVHEFVGQKVFDCDVPEATITRSLLEQGDQP